jgi:hypothetical protein
MTAKPAVVYGHGGLVWLDVFVGPHERMRIVVILWRNTCEQIVAIHGRMAGVGV